MKKLVYILLIVLGSSSMLLAQQMAPFNQYTEYPYLYNPSYVGQDSTNNVLLLYRNQWSGVTGAPEHGLVYVNTRLNDQTGVGGYLVHESANILGSTGGYISVSYRVSLAEDHQLSFGLAGGVLQKRILFERVKAQNTADPALLDGGQTQTKPDGSFGVRYQYKNQLEVHLAAQQLFGGTYGFVDQSLQRQSGFELLRHYYLGAFYHLRQLNLPVDLSLIGTLRSVQSLQSQWDIGIRAAWNDKLSATVLYRDDYGLGTFFTVNVVEGLRFGYAYEIPSNGIGLNQSQGSHEISLNILFGE